MCKQECVTCKYAEWDYCEGVGPGYPRGFSCGCGCDIPDSRVAEVYEEYGEAIPYDWNDEWGGTIDCPFWEDVDE